MGNHFYGRDGSCHTSNGGGELFIGALIKLGSVAAKSTIESEVLDFLRKKQELGNGWVQFDLDPLPSAIAAGEHLEFLARIVGALAESLIRGNLPGDLRDSFEGRDFQLKWAAWMLEFHRLIVQAASGEIGELEPTISDPEEALRVALYRVINELTHVHKREPENREKRLTLLSKQVYILEMLQDRPLLANTLVEKALLLDELNRTDEAVDALRRAAGFQSDPEQIKVLLDLASALES